ncbi:MAG: mechanosensitive ion channel family protein [Myxococcota bacterium]
MSETFAAWLEHPIIAQVIWLGALALAWLVVDFVLRRGVLRLVERIVLRSHTDWDDVLHDAKLFERLAPLVPALLAWYGVHLLPAVGESFEVLVGRISISVVILVAARAAGAFLTAANELYSRRPENAHRPIKGYIQVVRIVVAIVATILILATLFDRSPVIFLSGLGAMTAVILLIFRDTILSLVASVQITTNDMVRVGDWIEMPQFGADGDVVDVALHTVKVQNWDKTVTTIPTHRLITDSFKNWRFMSASGGRRIKRSVFIDVDSVRFLEPSEIARIGEFALLRDYVKTKREEIDAWNREQGRRPEFNTDIRRLTNLGTFRAYVERYLQAHPKIHRDMTLLVRQLAPTPEGIPIEVYCFTNTTEWNAYEGIQSDLFDHFLAVAPEFGLRVFQAPSSRALAGLARVDRTGGDAEPLRP